jgi:hypothetical protein
MKRMLLTVLNRRPVHPHLSGRAVGIFMLSESVDLSASKFCREGNGESHYVGNSITVAGWLNPDQSYMGGRCRRVLAPT